MYPYMCVCVINNDVGKGEGGRGRGGARDTFTSSQTTVQSSVEKEPFGIYQNDGERKERRNEERK
jgi:hypothetical protein